jgi:hypothetical protein
MVANGPQSEDGIVIRPVGSGALRRSRSAPNARYTYLQRVVSVVVNMSMKPV